MSKARIVTISAGAAGALLRGHPWVWREAVARAPSDLKTGDAVVIHDPQGRAIAQGLWDASSPIALRAYATTVAPALSAATIVEAIAGAFRRRTRWQSDSDTTAYRLCHGEGDRVPGVVIDRYGDVAVLRTDGDAIAPWVGEIAKGIFPLLEAMGVCSLGLRRERGEKGDRLTLLAGDPPPDTITVREHTISMVVDLAHGQKTGAFLDQRENRARVREMARGKRVLNLFSYAGGFSTAAVLGGAAHVTSVDVAQGAHATAQASMQANGIDPGAHAFVTADAFAFLESAKQKGKAWDLVISDPPSFAPNEKSLPRAMTAYRKLHGACAAVLSPGGIFCASSCSSHVSAEDFATTLDDAALGRADLSLVEMHGPPWDHPTLPGWPQGRYLKFAVLC